VLGLQEGLITTLPVATETCYFLQRRVGQSHAIAFLNRHAVGAYSIFALDERHIPRIAELMAQYADLPMDLADASLQGNCMKELFDFA
jgi:predicted nucleic acid-binding protein